MADDDSDESIPIYWKHSYIVGIIVGCALVTIIFAFSICIALKCMKKRLLSEPEYDTSMEKEGTEYYIEMDPEAPQVKQIQPILTVSEVFSSFKQAFENLGDTVFRKKSDDNSTKI